MKELFRDQDIIKVSFYKQLLDDEDIPCLIRNEHLQVSGLAEIPIPEFFPALNVVHDEDYPRAHEIIRKHLEETEQLNRETQDTEAPCPDCGETNPGNFAECWSCQKPLHDG